MFLFNSFRSNKRMLKTGLKAMFTALCLLSINLVYGQLAYVANNGDNTVAVVDLSTGTVVTSITLQGAPVKIAVAPDGSQIAAAGASFVSFLNPSDNSVINEVTNGTEVREVLYSSDGSTVYTVDQLTTLIQPFDAATQAEGTFGFLQSGTGPLAAAFDPATGNLLVVNNGSGNLANFTVGPLTQQLPNIPVGQAPQDIVFDPNGNTAYVPNFNNNNVSVVDIAAGTSTTIDGFDSPIAAEITPDGSTLFVINDGDNTIAVVDLGSGTVTGTITVGSEPRGLAVSEDGATLVVTNSADDNISVVDVATGEVTNTIDGVGDSPVSVILTAADEMEGPDLQEGIDEVVSNQAITEVLGLNFGGVNTGVITADGTVFTSVDGFSIPGVDLTEDQRLGVSEFTQTVLATLALALEEQGALTLDQTVGELIEVSGLTNIPGDRTIEQLLNHTSGYANFADADNYQSTVLFDATRAFTPEEITELFVGPAADAGTFSYSNTNFLVLGLVLEAAGGGTLQSLIDDLIAGPAGLTGIELYSGTDPDDLAPLFADVFGTGFPQQLSPNTSVLTGASFAGNLLATPADVVQFIQAVDQGNVISEAGVEKLLTFMPSADRIGTGYGLGIEEFEVEINGTATTVVGHTGNINYVSTLLYSPLADVGAYVVTSNGVATEQQVFDLALELLNVSIDSIPEAPEEDADTAFVQIVHNAADPAAEVVDIYVVEGMDTTLLDDVAFRTATAFLPLPAGTDLEVVVAGPDSESAADGLASFDFNLNADSSYYLVANGVLDTAGFAPNPEGLDIGFNLFAFEGARQEGVTDSLVDVNVFHGSTDAPNVGVNANGATIIPGFSYGDFSDYLSVPAQAYQLDVTPGGDTSTVLFSFEADLTGTEGAAALVLASGFVDTSANAGGAEFGLLAVFADGTSALLPAVQDTVPEDTAFTLQLLHASDLEGGVDAIENAPNFAAIIDTLKGEFENTLIISGGDNVIPGPFFNASGDGALRPVFQDIYQTLFNEPGLTNIREGAGRADITIMNIIGFDASAVGNHEFDAGTDALAEIIGTDIRGAGLSDVRWLGAQFPYLSANLDFSGDGSLSELVTTDILDNTAFRSTPDDLDAAAAAPKLAPATTIERGGETIGVIGATTQFIESISSTGDVEEISSDGTVSMSALAAVIQPVIDQLTAQGIDKVILTTHLQQIALEKELATLLSGVDIIVAGGSDILQAQEDDVLRPGDEAEEGYPFLTTNLDGDPVAIVGTDGEYTYVGRLVVTFNDEGVIDTASLSDPINGAYATIEEVVNDVWGGEDPFVEDSKGELVTRLTDAITEFVNSLDSIIVGRTDVFLEGRRDFVRTEETNLGSLTADANLAAAQAFDESVVISLKNGGGIRAAIGIVDSDNGDLLPPPANPETGKEEGDVSALDVVNSLRFNNGLTLLTLTAEELQAVLEHAVEASSEDPSNQPGRFPQLAGVSILVDLSKPEGSRVGEAFLIDADGNATDTIVSGGQLVADPASTYRIVTLNFLADGGDGYPFPSTDRVDLADELTEPGNFEFADPGTEQDAFAEFLFANFFDTPFAEAETPRDEDTRIRFGEFEAPADPGVEDALQAILDESNLTEVVPGLSFGGISTSVVTSDGQSFDLVSGDASPIAELTAESRLGASEVSQTIAAALTLALMEEGALMLSQTVGDFIDVSGLTNVPENVTIAQLLSHTSGLDDFGADEDYKSTVLFDVTREFTAEEITELFVDAPGETGTFSYSNTNFLVLGLVLEAANGDETLQQSFDRLISTPLGLSGLEIYQNTGDPADSLTFGDPADLAPLFADVFGTGFPQQVRPHTSVFSGAGAAGDLIGTSASFLSILEGLADGAIISDSNFVRMTDFVDIDGRLSDAYGLGIEEFDLNINGVELPFIGHVGSINYVTVALYNAETGAGVHLATNNGVVSEEDALELARQLLQVAASDVANDTATAFAQVIHNAADPAAEVVDIYVVDGDDVTKLDDVAFRTATGFLELPAAREIEVAVAGPDSESEADAIATFPVTLEDGKSYYITATGVLDPAGFASNPDGQSTAFNLFVTDDARQEAEDPELVDLNVFHGATDVVAVGVLADGAELIGSTTYGSYAGFVSVPPAEYLLELTARGLPSAVIDSFIADVSGLAGAAGLVVASGFDDPSANQMGEPFGLFLALPMGGDLIELPRPEEPVDTVEGFLQVLDRDNNVVIEDLVDGTIIDLNAIGNIPLNIKAMPDVEGVGSIAFDLEGPLPTDRIENSAPFFLFGDVQDDPSFNLAQRLPLGSYTLTVQVYSEILGMGELLDELIVSFEVVDETFLTATSFDVLDMQNNVLIEGLEEGAVINLADFDNIPLNFRANFDNNPGSVLMKLDGPVSDERLEFFAPYTVFGDNPDGNNVARKLEVGSYTLSATAFELPFAEGTEGEVVSVSFTVIDGAPELDEEENSLSDAVEGINIFPNPSRGRVNIQLNDRTEGLLNLSILNTSGRVLRQFNFAKGRGVLVESVDLSDLPNGIYIVRTIVQDKAQFKRFMITK